MEAELFALLAATLNEKARWYPQTLYYAGYAGAFPFFLRATQHKHFQKLVMVFGIKSAEDLRSKVKEGFARMNVKDWTDFRFYGR